MGRQQEEERFENSDSFCNCPTRRQVTRERHDEVAGKMCEYSARNLPRPKRAVCFFNSTVRAAFWWFLVWSGKLGRLRIHNLCDMAHTDKSNLLELPTTQDDLTLKRVPCSHVFRCEQTVGLFLAIRDGCGPSEPWEVVG